MKKYSETGNPEKNRLCPNCGSEKVRPDERNIYMFKVNPSIWKCMECSYTGLMPKKNSEETKDGKDTYRYFIKLLFAVTSPL
ncbi:MAG: hypothetical protein ABEI78_00080, partial [Candidatus Nanohaloarchaea archaeon]